MPTQADTSFSSADTLGLYAELLLCLGQAFLSPRDEAAYEALREDLAQDLHSFNEALGFADPDMIPKLGRALHAASDADGGFLRVYSRLFLAPPVPAPLNAGIYLDGALMGRSTQTMEGYYQRHGLALDPGFRDLPDHLALQLQFVAYLHTLSSDVDDSETAKGCIGDARDFVKRLLLPWIPDFVSRLQSRATPGSPEEAYCLLAHITEAALRADYRVLETFVPAESATEMPVAKVSLDEALASHGMGEDNAAPAPCRNCGQIFTLGRDLAFMIHQLESKGLMSEHLRVCPDCRAGGMELGTATPRT